VVRLREVVPLRLPPVHFSAALSPLKAGQLQFLIRKTVAFAAALGGEIMKADDATPEKLWQRHTEESPHTSDDEIERLFIAAAKDSEDFIRQIMEWGLR
jgi:hypothetical protein